MIRNRYMKTLVMLTMDYFLYWDCGSLNICYLFSVLFKCLKCFVLKCKQKKGILLTKRYKLD